MRIGQLATRAGVNIQTIRFYERRRILSAPLRSPSGYRQYTESYLDDLRVIRRCQQLGFTLKEIQQLLELHRAVAELPGNGSRQKQLRAIAELGRVRLAHIEQKLRNLRSMRMELLVMLERLESVSTSGCPGAPGRRS